jgi:hypothetical protein
VICEHRFVPFPGSLTRLYCERCGDGRDAFAGVDVESPRRRATVRAVEPEEPENQQPGDPDLEHARQILAQRRAAASAAPPDDDPEALARVHLEAKVRQMVEEAGLPEDQAEELIAQALDFGDALDLDRFAEMVNATARQGYVERE